MRVTTTCPTPTTCGATSHRAGTAAAARCAARLFRRGRALARATAPGGVNQDLYLAAHTALIAETIAPYADLPHDQRADPETVRGLIQAALSDVDARAGHSWTSGDGPHPTGGYHHRTLSVEDKHLFLRYRGADSKVHRADGPADVVMDRGGALIKAGWYHHGQHHSEFGPSLLDARAEVAPRFHHHDAEIGDVPGASGGRGAELSVRLAAHRAAGASAREAMSWLVVGEALDDHVGAVELREAGADADLCLQAARAGVGDLAVLAEVGHGRTPLSWAVAGL